MGMVKAEVCAAIALTGLMISGAARAADTTIAAGQEFTLSAPLMLGGADNFTAGAMSGARCTLHGGGFAISSAPGWTGSMTIRNCDIDGLGDANNAGILVTVLGTATATIQGSTFSTSGRVDITAGVTPADLSTVIVQNNTINANSVVPAVTLQPSSQPAFAFQGPSTGMKVFQGNLLLKSRASFALGGGWLVGGDQPGQGNIMVGLRAGFDLARVSDIQVRGNYSHTMRENVDWNQVKNLSIIEATNVLVEHNVFWGLNWLLEIKGGAEIRYNLLIDNVERGWVLVWDDVGATIHHNVMVSTRDNGFQPAGAIAIETGADMTTPQILSVYNNTFDGAGKCNLPIDSDVVLHSSFLSSLRSNAFVGARVASGGDANAFVHGPSTSLTLPLATGLGYSDYNLFYNPDSPVLINYGTGVQGKTARTDPGFGYHDAMPGGAPNQQVDPKFAVAMPPRTFPYKESDIIARATTVCQVLAYYRQIYSPGAGSPLVGGGDPADGAGNNIGAIGAGEAADLFGKLCDPTDIGQPDTAPDVYTCPDVTMPGVGGAGGAGGGAGKGGGGTGGGGTGGGGTAVGQQTPRRVRVRVHDRFAALARCELRRRGGDRGRRRAVARDQTAPSSALIRGGLATGRRAHVRRGVDVDVDTLIVGLC